MVGAFQKISQSEPASAGALANEVSISLITTLIGMIPAFIGVILMSVALF
jgi:biopolymer transport protein ExbB/TolQ